MRLVKSIICVPQKKKSLLFFRCLFILIADKIIYNCIQSFYIIDDKKLLEVTFFLLFGNLPVRFFYAPMTSLSKWNILGKSKSRKMQQKKVDNLLSTSLVYENDPFRYKVLLVFLPSQCFAIIHFWSFLIKKCQD